MSPKLYWQLKTLCLRNNNMLDHVSRKYRKEITMKERIMEVIDQIRPMLQRDGGDVEFVDVDENGVVKVRLKGACGNCPGALYTLKNGVERTIKQYVPNVKEVVRVN